jgi:predicted component of type VI protein secretion system
MRFHRGNLAWFGRVRQSNRRESEEASDLGTAALLAGKLESETAKPSDPSFSIGRSDAVDSQAELAVTLTLEVTSPQASQLGGGKRKSFGHQGGSIGRDKASSWVLPHTKVSARHANISFRNGVFYIEDTSTNGVFLNSRTNRLVRGRPQALKSGDCILVEPYVIEVVVSNEIEVAPKSVPHGGPQAADPFDLDDPFEPGGVPLPSITPTLEPRSEALAGQELDPLKLLGGTPKESPRRNEPVARDLELRSPLDRHYQAPALPAPVVAAAPVDDVLPAAKYSIPEGYDPLGPDDPEPLPQPREVPRVQTPVPDVSSSPIARRPTPAPIPPEPTISAAPAEASKAPSSPEHTVVDFSAVLEGAGLDPDQVTPELAQTFGQIVRVVVSGVMDILRARQQIKDEFRLRMTQFRPADNNPLKFSANVDDALHNLLVKRNAAYLEPVEAFEDAFDDLRDHQIAMLAGMRVAFESMLASFDPDRLQEQFDRVLKRGSLLGVPAKLRYWDLFRDQREELQKDPDDAFRKLFGEEFARAYEAQLQRLKSQRLPRSKPDPEPEPEGR